MSNKNLAILVNYGISPKKVVRMSESEIDALAHKILVIEQVTEMPPKKTYKVGPTGGNLPSNRAGYSIKTNPSTKEVIAISNEGELGEMTKKNPWAICTAKVGRDNEKRYERCVKAVKKSIKEGIDPIELFLSNKINRIVERNLSKSIEGKPHFSIVEQETKPETKPKVKPSTPTKPKPAHPGKNPTPKIQPAPKARKKGRGQFNEQEVEPATKPAPTKPATPTKPRPAHPGKNPTPGVQPAPKAADKERLKREYINLIMQILK